MVDTAIAPTITMPVAADSPLMKAASASAGAPVTKGSESTKVSGSARLAPKCNSPPSAIGSTNRLMSSRWPERPRWRGCTWRLSTFSTTITWNWRGRKITEHVPAAVSAHYQSANRIPH